MADRLLRRRLRRLAAESAEAVSRLGASVALLRETVARVRRDR